MKTENRIDHYIDLHAHLDGCITTEIARKLAALQQITLPAATDEELLSLLLCRIPAKSQMISECFEPALFPFFSTEGRNWQWNCFSLILT